MRSSASVRQQRAFEDFRLSVKASGIPKDSLERFMTAGYVPQPKQLLFHSAARACDYDNGPTDIGFGGARGPGKSHAAFAQLVLDDCQRVPELNCLFLRRVGKAARESFEALRRNVLRGVPHHYSAHIGQLSLPNSSRVVLGHFRNEADIDSYLGLEYDVIVIEEDTQLTAQKKKDIATCLRTSKPHWRPRTYRTTNPGGVDHRGFKEKFIIPFRDGKEKANGTRFIPATVYDNRFVNKGYKAILESLTGWKRRAWLEGDWDIEAGQFFSTWRQGIHVIDKFEISPHWPMWVSLDYGFTHPSAWYFYAECEDKIYVTDEHVEAKLLPDSHAEIVKARLGQYGRTFKDGEDEIADVPVVAGGDAFAQKGDRRSQTIADQYKDCGITLRRAAMDRITGWSEILRRLGDTERKGGKQPTLYVFRNCQRLINCLPTLQHDELKPEDVMKTNADPETGEGGDDEADSLRYGVMFRYKSTRQADRDSALGKAVINDNWY